MTATTSASPVGLLERPAAHLDPDEIGGIGLAAHAVALEAEFDAARLAAARGPRERGEIGRAVGDMDAVEQAVALQPRDRRAEHGFGRGRDELDRAVAAMTRDHVAHVARQQAIAIFLDIEQRDGGARQQLGAERKPRGIERRRYHAERRSTRRATPGSDPDAGSKWKWPSTIRSAAHDIASAKANATTRREADSAASIGTTTSQIAAKDSIPPWLAATIMTRSAERQRRQHMRALVAAGARQKPGQQDRRDQPGEGRDFDRGRRAAHRQIDRERRERRQAAEQPRRHEGAMARARQRIVSRRRMQQRIETIADDTQNISQLSRFGLFVQRTRRNASLIFAVTVSERT